MAVSKDEQQNRPAVLATGYPTMSNWILLLLAAVLNIGTVYFAKASDGMTRLWPTLA